MDLILKRQEAGGTQSIGRAALLLRVLATAGPDGLALGDVAAKAGIERPTAHRILRRLVDEALVMQRPRSRNYHLGPLLYELGLAAAPAVSVQELCTAALAELARLSGDSAFLMVRSGLDSVCLQRREGHFPIKVLMLGVGQRRPLGCGAGSIALMSLMPDEQVDEILRVNRVHLDRTGEPAHDDLLRIVQQAREQGVATKDAPDLPVRSLSMVVRDAEGRGVCALSVTSLTQRIEQRRGFLVSSLQQITQELSSKLPAGLA